MRGRIALAMRTDIQEVLRSEALTFLEAPRFSDDGALYFGDAIGHGFYRYTETKGIELIDPGAQSVGGCVLHQRGGVIFSCREGLKHYDPIIDQVKLLPLSMDGQPLMNINDIEADSKGNLFGGTLDSEAFENNRAPEPGFLFKVDGQGKAERLGYDVAISNGIAFSLDGTAMYFSESGEGVFRYRMDELGRVGDRQLWLDLEDSDGIALDEEGGLWVAKYMHNSLAYYDPDGRLIQDIETPMDNVASVVFGGAENRELFVVGGSLSSAGKGAVFKLVTDIPGLATYRATIPL